MLRGLHRILPRVYRLGVVAVVVWLMHQQHQWFRAQRVAALEVAQVQPLFPSAAKLGPRTPPHNTQTVFDDRDLKLGLVLHTSPETDSIRGYTGPSDALLGLDSTGRVIGATLLSSEDTADHVAKVIEDHAFWRSFHGLAIGSPGRPEIDTVSGATLTSDAIINSITTRLGGEARVSSLFPTEILLVEVQLLLPEAHGLQPHPDWEGVQQVTNANDEIIAHALRTSPSQDSLLGYQGPTDTLILLDAQAKTVRSLRFRKSYDNQDYYDRVLEDDSYLRLFDGWALERVVGLDLESAGIQGVSGATHTSWAITEGVRRRLEGFLAQRDRPAPTFPVTPRQLGLIGLTLAGLLMSFTRLRGRAGLRLGWQVFLIVYLGFLTGDLLSQALLAGWAQNGVSWTDNIGMVFLAAAAFIIPWTTGHQLYCHHLCPHGALQQWMQKLRLPNIQIHPKVHRLLTALPILLLAFVLGNVMLGLGLNNAAVEPFDAYLFRIAGWASITIAILGLLASAFIPLAYCKYGCPTGLLLKFFRSRGASDRFGHRDLAAAALLAGALSLHLVR